MSDRVYIYDSTLRDGSQARGVDFGVADKQAIALELDKLGIDYIEGGWPGANPTDDAFFAARPKLKHAKLSAFGMTRKSGRSAANDPGLADLLGTGVKSICIVGKSSRFQVEKALEISLSENLKMIESSVAYLAGKGVEVLFDAEHFFDGFKEDSEYASACARAAFEAGARWVVLCDTNGGSLPFEVEEIVGRMSTHIPGKNIGIHCHNDTENAVANSLAAVRAGARQVQGTINGVGERCGNANLVSVIPSLILKMGLKTGVNEDNLAKLTHISRFLDDRLNRQPNPHAPYVGAAAFAHKGGLHASAVSKLAKSYEHIDPSVVGNSRSVLVSDKAGRASIAGRLKEMGIKVAADDDRISALLREVKERENQGYAYEGADASFELLARRILGKVPQFFELKSFRVISERRYNARGKLVTESEATVKLDVNGTEMLTAGEGNGPVNALDEALRRALSKAYPVLEHMWLVDYKVRILTPTEGTKAVTRVLIESADDKGVRWSTIGVSANVVDASYNALEEALNYKLVISG